MKIGVTLALTIIVSLKVSLTSCASASAGPAKSVTHRTKPTSLNEFFAEKGTAAHLNHASVTVLDVDDESRSLLSGSTRSSRSSVVSTVTVPRGGNNMSLTERLKIGFYFALWYFLNVIYNIVNKKLLNVVPAPVTIGTIQLGIGALYAALLWVTGLRAKPKLTEKGREICTKVGFYHGSGQLFSIVSLGAGPVSFTHIVKALEPFFSAIVSALVFGKWMKPQVYATLIPVVGGVGYACLKERSFSWLAFGMAMASNVSFALRAVVSKQGMTNYIGDNMTSVNLFAVVTMASFFLCIPAAAISEKSMLIGLWEKATTGKDAVTTSPDLMKTLIFSGLFHYLNNEVMYLALSNVHPVTLAVGNTMKRVFIMVASVLVFRNPVSIQAGIGAGIGISGVLLYSLTKQYYEKLDAKEAAAALEATKGKRKSKFRRTK